MMACKNVLIITLFTCEHRFFTFIISLFIINLVEMLWSHVQNIKFVTIACKKHYEDFFPIACNSFKFFIFTFHSFH